MLVWYQKVLVLLDLLVIGIECRNFNIQEEK